MKLVEARALLRDPIEARLMQIYVDNHLPLDGDEEWIKTNQEGICPLQVTVEYVKTLIQDNALEAEDVLTDPNTERWLLDVITAG